MVGMRVGGRRKIAMPYTMGFGEAGNELAPPKAMVVCDVVVESSSARSRAGRLRILRSRKRAVGAHGTQLALIARLALLGEGGERLEPILRARARARSSAPRARGPAACGSSTPRSIASLAARTATGPFAAIASASSSAASRSSPGGAMRLTSPMRSASRASSLRAGQDQVLRARLPDQARQALRAARAGDDRERRLRQAELGVRRRDAQVAREHELRPAAERDAVDDGDRRLRQRLDVVHQRADVPHEVRHALGAASSCAPSGRRRRRRPCRPRP